MKHTINRKKIAIRSILCIQATGFFYDNSRARSYPIKEVSKPECKKEKWSDLSPECKQPLPRIENAQYANYINNPQYKLVYSTLWGAPYSDGWAYGKWSHEWVDIATSEGTPVVSIGDWIVTRARSQAWYGNVVMIKHTMPDKKVIYSIYGHLHTIDVTEWDNVKEGELIGTVGNVWFSFGNHLLRNINVTPTNTYAFWGCPELGNGTSFNDLARVVDNGLCRDYLLQRTIDPIAFIESNGTILWSAPILAPTSKTINRSIVVKKPIVPLAPSNSIKTTTPIAKPAEAAKPVVSVPKPTTTFTTATIKPTDDFLKKWNIVVTSNFGTTLQKGGSSSIGISIADKSWAGFAWVVDKEISIMPSKQNIILSPRVIRYVSEGKIVSLIEAKDVGTSEMVVSYGNTVIGKLVVTVQ
jgi:hypothetical protein